MVIEAATIARLIWNTQTHISIVCMTREGECLECALNAEHVLADPALHSSPEGRYRPSKGPAAER
jgi:hypothetical protein